MTRQVCDKERIIMTDHNKQAEAGARSKKAITVNINSSVLSSFRSAVDAQSKIIGTVIEQQIAGFIRQYRSGNLPRTLLADLRGRELGTEKDKGTWAVDYDISIAFDTVCRAEKLNKSRLLEHLMSQWLADNPSSVKADDEDKGALNQIHRGYWIDKDVSDKFVALTDKLGIVRSRLLQSMIENWIKENSDK